MRQRSTLPLQITVLVSATLMEVAANFAANAVQSPTVRFLGRIAPVVVVVLLGVTIVGEVVVHRQAHPAAPRPPGTRSTPPTRGSPRSGSRTRPCSSDGTPRSPGSSVG